MLGRSRQGKTTLLIKLINQLWKKVFRHILIISPTVNFDPSYRRIYDPELVTRIPHYHELKLRKIMDQLEEWGAEDHPTLIVFDDPGGTGIDVATTSRNKIVQFVSASRWRNISICFLAQQMQMVPTVLRANVESVIYFEPQNADHQKELYRTAGFGRMREFVDFNECMFQNDYDHILRDAQGSRASFWRNFIEKVYPLPQPDGQPERVADGLQSQRGNKIQTNFSTQSATRQ